MSNWTVQTNPPSHMVDDTVIASNDAKWFETLIRDPFELDPAQVPEINETDQVGTEKFQDASSESLVINPPSVGGKSLLDNSHQLSFSSLPSSFLLADLGKVDNSPPAIPPCYFPELSQIFEGYNHLIEPIITGKQDISQTFAQSSSPRRLPVSKKLILLDAEGNPLPRLPAKKGSIILEDIDGNPRKKSRKLRKGEEIDLSHLENKMYPVRSSGQCPTPSHSSISSTRSSTVTLKVTRPSSTTATPTGSSSLPGQFQALRITSTSRPGPEMQKLKTNLPSTPLAARTPQQPAETQIFGWNPLTPTLTPPTPTTPSTLFATLPVPAQLQAQAITAQILQTKSIKLDERGMTEGAPFSPEVRHFTLPLTMPMPIPHAQPALIPKQQQKEKKGRAKKSENQEQINPNVRPLVVDSPKVQDDSPPRRNNLRGVGSKVICEVCRAAGKTKYTFTRPSSLTRHLRRHTGEKKYQCAACPKAFVAISTLRRHEKTHTHVKDYVCLWGSCGRAFADNVNLKRHLKNVHKVEPVEGLTGKQTSLKKNTTTRQFVLPKGRTLYKAI